MSTKLISQKSLDIINQYENFQVGKAICSVPYFNNNHKKLKASLAVNVGKGSPKEIHDEVEQILIKEKIDKNLLTSESLKRLLIDNDIGIDCSGFVYHVLDIKKINFPYAKGILGKIKAKLSPIKNVDVQTLAHNSNSKIVPMTDAQPGDIITTFGKRDHIVIIYKIDYENNTPKILHYVESVALPTDGQYNHGIHKGKIETVEPQAELRRLIIL